MAEGLFAGLRVIDCASFIAAPAAATIFSDFGADVIKIEPPGEGDLYRTLHVRPGSPKTSRDYAWILDNRNKRGLALDLKSERGHEVLCRLVEKADVFITNMPFPVRRKLKTGYNDLKDVNPRLIYASFTAYGEAGPEAEKTGFDSTAYWARSGLMDMVRPDAEATPARSSPGMGDHPSAVALFSAIMTALWRRERTGRGGQVSSSLVANGLWSNSYLVQARLIGAEFPPRPKRTHVLNPLSNSYRCKDGRWFILSMVNEARQYAPFMAAIGLSHLTEKYAAQADRQKNSPELIEIYDKVFSEKTLEEWRKILDSAGITFGIVNTLDDLVDDEQARHAGAIVPFADGSGLTISSPFNVDGETKRQPATAPSIGQHSDEILREHGYDDADIRKLRDTKAVG
ncbi:CoA transferase [Bradyrhizobium sp. LHD-71]|uniref:CaiB/BaiF CoA transferase family protein n=1 Tax=Bradyrhizobium sp. LHD-71 TaxID=3072141 RepID=UPI00280DCB75|nr:CoA transferase [Bradyrhizobium sp. LHD-71]MDQ8730287.1 CoA transferase [Bradyrhizobium sp. LHD-71]